MTINMSLPLHLPIQSDPRCRCPTASSRYGDYHVIRENKRVATLIELGYLSNPVEELTINIE